MLTYDGGENSTVRENSAVRGHNFLYHLVCWFSWLTSHNIQPKQTASLLMFYVRFYFLSGCIESTHVVLMKVSNWRVFHNNFLLYEACMNLAMFFETMKLIQFENQWYFWELRSMLATLWHRVTSIYPVPWVDNQCAWINSFLVICKKITLPWYWDCPPLLFRLALYAVK